MDYLTLAVNLKNLAISQYVNYNFSSFLKINGVAVGMSQDGIFELDNLTTDDAVEIDAFVELVRSDWGIANLKRIKKFYMGYEATGEIDLSLTTDEGAEELYTFKPTMIEGNQGSGFINGRRRQSGRYWQLKISNTLGCDFSIDSITVSPTVLIRKPGGN